MKYKIIIALMLFTVSTKAHQLGSFTDSVSFNSHNRVLSCYVPTNYDSSLKY